MMANKLPTISEKYSALLQKLRIALNNQTELHTQMKPEKININFVDSNMLNEFLITHMLQNIFRLRYNKAEVYVRSIKIISIESNVIKFGMLKHYGVLNINIDTLIEIHNQLLNPSIK